MTLKELYEKKHIDLIYAKAISDLLKIEVFMKENGINPAKHEPFICNSKKIYSIGYDKENNELTLCIVPLDMDLPFFAFYKKSDAYQIIEGCKNELLEIFDYFSFYRGY